MRSNMKPKMSMSMVQVMAALASGVFGEYPLYRGNTIKHRNRPNPKVEAEANAKRLRKMAKRARELG